jgi:serine palmitoyltransferase
MGGYIAASKEIIDFIKTHAAGIQYHNSLSPVVTKQIITAFKVIMGEDGTSIGRQKIATLAANSNYFRTEMVKMGLHVYGNYDSPIIPIMLYSPCKIAAFSRECLKRGLQ